MSSSRGVRLATKIWLSIAILIVGYSVSEFYRFQGSQQLEQQIEYISKHLVPATQAGQLALIAVRQQASDYKNAPLFEQPDIFESAKEAGARAQQELNYISNMTRLPSALRERAASLLVKLKAYTAQADDLTPRLIQLSVEEKEPPYNEIQAVKEREKELLDQMQLFRADLERLLRSDQEGLIDRSWTRRMYGLAVFILSIGLAVILVNIALRVWVTGPIARTMVDIENMGSGIVPATVAHDGDEMTSLRSSFSAMRDAIVEHITSLEKEIKERITAENALQHHRDHLEDMVRQRTEELSNTIKELQQTQQQLVEAEKMQALGVMVAGIAHEINTPVGVGITAVSFLKDQIAAYRLKQGSSTTDPASFNRMLGTAEECTGMIMTNLERAAQLVSSFKQVAVDQSSEQPRTFDLAGYLNEIVISLTPRFKQGGHRVSVDAPAMVAMTSFPGALSQVITNLVMNSTIHGFGERREGRITIIATVSSGQVRLVYSDDGEGMTAEVLHRLYEPFFTTKRGQGGSGLGMQLVYNLVTHTLQGSIACESDPGKGTTFIIKLPLVLADATDSGPDARRPPRSTSKNWRAVQPPPAAETDPSSA